MTFVVVEGPDGAGKSRLQRALADQLRRQGHDPVELREPGSTPVGEHLRKLLLDPAVGHLDPLTEALLFSAARTEMVRSVILPALAAGRIVLLDRWHWSTTAYQGAGGGVPADLVERLAEAATGGLKPDLVIVLDLDPAAAANRRSGRDRMERRGREFEERVAAAYRELARREPATTCVIDASQPFDTVLEQARARVDALVAARGSRG